MPPSIDLETPDPQENEANESTIEHNVCVKFDHLKATAISVDVTGAYAVLAGRKGLYLVDLEAPFYPSRTLHHQSQWDVGVVKFNPHSSHKGYIASTSNHNTLIWNVGEDGTASQPLLATLRAHSRPVSDVSWSRSEPTLLSTCSADGCLHLWDTRTPQKPVQTMRTVTSSASRMEWNRIDHTTLASAHDGDVRIWDTRYGKENTPVVLITAHTQSIYDLDWNPKRMYELLTCSEDHTVKFWDATHPRSAHGTITTGAPVWRARYTPFGDAILTSSNRFDNSLRLWSLTYSHEYDIIGPYVSIAAAVAASDTETLGSTNTIVADQVHVFSSHAGFVKGFDWRQQRASGAFQLVSWSQKQQLGMWKVETKHLEACGYIGDEYEQKHHRKIDVSKNSEENVLLTGPKYDFCSLKNDFSPVIAPQHAIPLSLSNYDSYRRYGDSEALLDKDSQSILTLVGGGSEGILETKVGKDINQPLQRNLPGDDRAYGESSDIGLAEQIQKSLGKPTKDTALPCPRFFGACFNSANVLVVFNSSNSLNIDKGTDQKSGAYPKTYAALLRMKKRVDTLDFPPSALSLGSQFRDTTGLDQLAGVEDDGIGMERFAPNVDYLNYQLSNYTQLHDRRIDEQDAFQCAYTPEEDDQNDFSRMSSSYDNKGFYLSRKHVGSIGFPQWNVESRRALASDDIVVHGENSFLNWNRAAEDQFALQGHKYSARRRHHADSAFTFRVRYLDLSAICLGSWSLAASYSYSVEENPSIKNVKTEEEEVGARTLSAMELSIALNRGEGMLERNSSRKRADSAVDARTLYFGAENFSLSSGPVEKQTDLAERPTISDLCRRNAMCASRKGYGTTAQVWKLLEAATDACVMSTSNTSPEDVLQPWVCNPLGRSLMNRILEQHELLGDVQTLASIACILGNMPKGNLEDRSDADVLPVRNNILSEIDNSASRLHSVSSSPNVATLESKQTPKTDMGHKSLSFVDLQKKAATTWGGNATPSSRPPLTKNTFIQPRPRPPVRSGSDSALEALASPKQEERQLDLVISEPFLPENSNKVLSKIPKGLLYKSPTQVQRYDNYKKMYGDLLYRWGAMRIRAEVLKHRETPQKPHSGITFGVICSSCSKPVDGFHCSKCHDFAMQCSVCQLVVRGISLFCFNCGHGGHNDHVRSWFETEETCPTGCGCRCKFSTGAHRFRPPHSHHYLSAVSASS